MADFPFDIVGFDLDGTLLDTGADLTDALNHVLARIGRGPLSVAEVMPLVGRGTRHMLERGLEASGGGDAALADRLYPELIDYYRTHIARGTQPYPGLIAALDALEARGVALAVVTNKPESLAVQLLGELGLASRFRTIIGGDTLGPGNAKPSPAPILEMIRRCGGGRAAFVGDSRFDIEAARNAGVPSVAAGFGFLTQPAEELGADAVIDRYDGLLPALERLGVAEMEARLRAAMLAGDVAALDELLDDDLVFTDQNGRRLGKADDLAAHRSGLLRLDRIEAADAIFRVEGDTALVAVRVELAGSYAGQGFSGAFAYTRVWLRRGGKWRIAAAHCSAVA